MGIKMTNIELLKELRQRVENGTFGYTKIMEKPDEDILNKCYTMRYSKFGISLLKNMDEEQWYFHFPQNFDFNQLQDNKIYLLWIKLPPIIVRNSTLFTENHVVYIEEFSPEMLELENILRNEVFKELVINKKKLLKMSNTINFYTGNIEPEENTIFVFGSNPEGRHGLGSAKVAVQKFGAKYGIGEGLVGNSYGIPTKDLRVLKNNGLRSISEKDIIKSIQKMYQVAEANPDKTFKIAYRNKADEVTLNGYNGREMFMMFLQATDESNTFPKNIQFSEEWKDIYVNLMTEIFDFYNRTDIERLQKTSQQKIKK